MNTGKILKTYIAFYNRTRIKINHIFGSCGFKDAIKCQWFTLHTFCKTHCLCLNVRKTDLRFTSSKVVN